MNFITFATNICDFNAIALYFKVGIVVLAWVLAK